MGPDCNHHRFIHKINTFCKTLNFQTSDFNVKKHLIRVIMGPSFEMSFPCIMNEMCPTLVHREGNIKFISFILTLATWRTQTQALTLMSHQLNYCCRRVLRLIYDPARSYLCNCYMVIAEKTSIAWKKSILALLEKRAFPTFTIMMKTQNSPNFLCH